LRLSLNQIWERHFRVIPKAKLDKGDQEMIGIKTHRRGILEKPARLSPPQGLDE